MNSYETMVILEPALPDSEVEKMLKGIETEITTGGGTVANREIYGKRQLAYKIKGNREGIYAVMNFNLPSSGMKAIEKKLKMTSEVIRHLVIKLE